MIETLAARWRGMQSAAVTSRVDPNLKQGTLVVRLGFREGVPDSGMFWALHVTADLRGQGFMLRVCGGPMADIEKLLAVDDAWSLAGELKLVASVRKWISETTDKLVLQYSPTRMTVMWDTLGDLLQEHALSMVGTKPITKVEQGSQLTDEQVAEGVRQWMAARKR